MLGSHKLGLSGDSCAIILSVMALSYCLLSTYSTRVQAANVQSEGEAAGCREQGQRPEGQHGGGMLLCP